MADKSKPENKPENKRQNNGINSDKIDLFDEDVAQCPFAAYAAVQQQGQVYREPRFGNFVLSHYADVLQLKDDSHYSALHGVDPPGRFPPNTYPDINRTDPPRHTRLKSFFYKSFSGPAIEKWRGDIEAIFHEHFDALTGTDFDIVEAVCYPVPAAVICKMLGFSDNRRSDFQRWSEALVERLGTEISTAQREALIEMARFIKRKAAEKKTTPGDDLMTDIVNAEVDGSRLSDEEIIANGVFFLAAGHETTANFLSNFTHQLALEPGLFDRLKADRSLISRAMDESLRLQSPVQNICRTVKKDMDLHGAPVGEGERVLFSLAAGNRDPSVFENPEEFDLSRDNGHTHLAFGYGLHQCLGARLARLEGEIFINIMLDRYEKITLSETPAGRPGNVMRGFKALGISVTPALDN